MLYTKMNLMQSTHFAIKKLEIQEKKGVLAYHTTLLDDKINLDTYSYKHKHFGKY